MVCPSVESTALMENWKTEKLILDEISQAAYTYSPGIFTEDDGLVLKLNWFQICMVALYEIQKFAIHFSIF